MKHFILLTLSIAIFVSAPGYADQDQHMMDEHMGSSAGMKEENTRVEPYGMMRPGMMGYGGCDMMHSGGRGMMGHHEMMHGGGVMNWRSGNSAEDQKQFLDNTVELRRLLMMKKFDYKEAMRNPDTKPEDLTGIEKDMWEIQKKIIDKYYE